MNFKFENLGIIEFADIEVRGLTVITGLNDTGKSFLGKGIFSITKTINRAERIYASSKIGTINQLSNQIFQLHRQFVPFTKEKSERFHPRNITNIVYPFISQESTKISDSEIITNINNYVDTIIHDLKEQEQNTPQFTSQIEANSKQIDSTRNQILKIFQEKATKEQKNKNYFNAQIIQGFFQGQVNSLTDESTLDIEVKEGVNQLIHAKIKNNITEEFNHSQAFLIKDATIIETPTIIQLEAFISNTFFYTDDYIQERADLPFHYGDLVQKIRIPLVTTNTQFQGTYEKIRKIIKGEFRINQNAGGGIEYLKENNIAIKASNVASGIKSFGLLQMLIKSNYISPDKYLIIDEPEVHLHPQWEIEYANIIVELALLGIKIIISSHSPYFLRKIRAAVIANKEAEKITEFYWGNKNITNGKTKFEKVTDNPEAVFEALAKAMSSTAYSK